MSTSKSKSSRSGGTSRSGTSSRSGKSSASRSGKSASSRSGSRTGKSSSSRSRTSSARTTRRKKEQPKPLRREIGALVCLLLAIFAAFGYFKIDAVFITFFCNLLKGLFGYGFWFAPPMLLVSSGILMFHRGRPVRRRLISALLVPFLMGGLIHVLAAAGEYGLGFKAVPQLWKSGLALTSGGVISGWISVLFCKVFSRIGAAVLFLLALFFCNMILTRITPVDIWDGIKAFFVGLHRYFQERPPYEEDEYDDAYDDGYDEEPEPAPARASRRRDRKAARKEPAPTREPERQEHMPPMSRSRKRSAIDIPLEEGGTAAPAESGKKERPEGYFDTTPGVRPPHELLEQEAREEPEVSAEPAVPAQEAPDPLAGPDLKLPNVPEQEADVPVVEAEVVPAAEVPKSANPTTPQIPVSKVAPGVVRKVEAAEEPSEQRKKSEAAVAAARARMGNDSDTYQYPPVYLLEKPGAVSNAAAADELQKTRELLDDTIQSFGIDARIINVTRGPSVTRYELELMRGVKLNKLTNLAGDIALSLGAPSVRIAPITGRNSVVGVEVPNQLVTPVPIREVIDSREFRTHVSKVAFAVGKDISGKNVVGNIAKLPHMLIAGTTGSGKSVCTNSLIISLLYKASPEDVRLIMVDPKMVELGIYNGIPHLLIPVVTDPKKAAGALQWAVTEMMKRYRLFSEVGVRDLASYNAHMLQNGEEKLPQVVVVIDELADLMLVAAKEVEESICRVAQMGRAAGMHLIIATQRPSSDVITGLMKANIPSRIAFAVASSLESRIILDTTGAEKLVGKGDMLYAPLGIGKPLRVQGCMITDEEVAKVVEFIKQNSTANYDDSVMREVESNAENTGKGGKGSSGSSGGGNGGASNDASGDDADELLPAAIEVVVETGMASVSMLQRRLKLGYSRAARLVDQMEERKIVGPFEGSKPRQVLITKEQWNQAKLQQGSAGGASPAQAQAQADEYAAALAMSEAADAAAVDTPDYLDDEEGDAPF